MNKHTEQALQAKRAAFAARWKLGDDLTGRGYKYHHTAYHGGIYHSRTAAPVAVPYSGRFGVGYKIISPTWRYSDAVRVDYYITD